jgi:hypothetical protein
MDCKCYKCDVTLTHFPLLCDMCGISMCLQCCNDDFAIPICEVCIDIQQAQLSASERTRCVEKDCNKWATISQPCISAETPENIVILSKKAFRKLKNGKQLPIKTAENLKECGAMANYCDEHVKKCMTCDKIICSYCSERKICWQDGQVCGFCQRILPKDSLHVYEVCGNTCCQRCADTNDRIDIWAGYSMCKRHRKHCDTCKSDKYKANTFKCQIPHCNDYSCIRTCQFPSLITPSAKIYVCHDHIATCLMCYMKYPLTNEKKINFRDGISIHCCTNCYIPNREASDWLLLCLHRMNIRVPRNVLDYIFKLMVVKQIR